MDDLEKSLHNAIENISPDRTCFPQDDTFFGGKQSVGSDVAWLFDPFLKPSVSKAMAYLSLTF